MAIAAEERNKSGIFWINDTSDDDQAVVYVPGVSRKPGLRQGSGGTGEGKGKAPVGFVHDKGNKRRGSQQSSHSGLSAAGMSSTKMTPSTRSASTKARSPAPSPKPDPEDQPSLAQAAHVKTKPSLRDLCPEDKRRIANLIQELARVSEEKEESVQKLRDEQETFERKILQLEQQNQLILLERESLQQQYRECQELLSLYQQYLAQQQDKLNQSIAQLNHTHSHTKASRSERSSRQSRSAKAATLDSSYLDLPSPRDTPVSRATAAAAPTTQAPSHSLLANHSPGLATPTPTTPPSTLVYSVSNPKPRSAARSRREHRPCPHAPPGPVATTTTTMPQGPEGGAEAEEGCERRGGGWAGVSVVALPAGGEEWEERRRRLVEQKRQLEQERERLQHRLALQEERLSQQLQHTRTLQDGSDAAGLEKPHPNGSLLKQPPEVNGYGEHSNERVSASHLAGTTLRSDVPLYVDPNLKPPKHTCSQETPPLTKKDMATSPAVPPSAPFSPPPAPAVPSCLPHTPHLPRQASPNSSLVELLEIFSPISLVECPRPRAPASTLRPPRHTLLPSAATPRSCLSPQDPEESQILEDIFFIC
ncbi:hypothetical protein ACEWY4_003969 [Coilia grayii]|uniref:Protein hinderin n=1 Tax=Coilia grayii TaxID=363190 RepID=A0ABD1KKD0_9TELE